MENKLLTTKEAMNILGYKNTYSIIQLIKRDGLPNAFKHKGYWRIPISDINAIIKSEQNTLSATETAHRFNYKNGSIITELIRNNTFPNAFKGFRGHWRIPLSDIENYERKTPSANQSTFKYNGKVYHDILSATQILGYKSKSTVLSYIRSGELPNSFKHSGKWWIDYNDLTAFKDKLKSKPKRRKKYVKNPPELKGYINLKEIQAQLKIDYKKAYYLFVNDNFNDKLKQKNTWFISKIEFEKHLKDNEKVKQNTLTLKEAGKELGLNSYNSSYNLLVYNKLPNAFKFNGKWRVPIEDVEQLKKERKETKAKINYTPNIAFSELKEYVDSIDDNANMIETKKIFLKYALYRFNNMTGSNRYIRDRILLFKRFYKKMITECNNELINMSTESLTELLGEGSPFKKDEKKLLIPFLRYVYNHNGIEPEIEFSLLLNQNRDETQDIYSPKVFHHLYHHVKSIELHLETAINDRSYANMWVYTILLLTDFIRGQDLILNTPNINLDSLEINSFEWFTDNKFSEKDAQLIINQLYLHFRHQRSSKTDELLTFIVAPDLIEPLAYALSISELHRKLVDSELILDTFISGIYSHIRTSGNNNHKKFFEQMKLVHEFKFSSLKMNRTVATYLFYSIVEEDGQDSDLALHLTKISRSHKRDDTTSKYIQATNKDGTINRVAYNLFKRGNFGWLYNYLILYVTQFEQLEDTLETRTKLIEEIRRDITPIQLENIAGFHHNKLSLGTSNDENDIMDRHLKNIYSKRQTVISKLKDFAKEEIKEILLDLAQNNRPSKNEHAQCLIYPNCNYPNQSNCFSCEFVIPGNLILIQLKDELQRLINNIKNTNNETLIQRDSVFLMHALLIWKEARQAFGEERINAFISTDKTWNSIETIAHKLTLTKPKEGVSHGN